MRCEALAGAVPFLAYRDKAMAGHPLQGCSPPMEPTPLISLAIAGYHLFCLELNPSASTSHIRGSNNLYFLYPCLDRLDKRLGHERSNTAKDARVPSQDPVDAH